MRKQSSEQIIRSQIGKFPEKDLLLNMKKILGMGNALTDILAVLPDDGLLKKFHLPKGSMQHVDQATGDKIWQTLRTMGVQYVAGGSAANTITGTAIFGMPSGFIGKVGDDELGHLFKSDQEQYGISSRLLIGKHASGRAMVFITAPNAERTFAVYLGAALELVPEELSPDMLFSCRRLSRTEPVPDSPCGRTGERGGAYRFDRHGLLQRSGIQQGVPS
jgi:sugar/nucleoside kinase (ribokinase family)